MNDTRKNILLDVMCSYEGLRDCLETLLAEEARSARRAGTPAAYREAMQTCDCLRRAIALTDDAVCSAGSAISAGERR